MRQEGREWEGQNSGEQRHEEFCGRERDGAGNMGTLQDGHYRDLNVMNHQLQNLMCTALHFEMLSRFFILFGHADVLACVSINIIGFFCSKSSWIHHKRPHC